MEDRHLLVSPIHSQAKDTHCFAVFDGHRGSEAAQYACNHMLQHLEDHWLAPTPEEALQVCYLGKNNILCLINEPCRNSHAGHSGC